MAAPTLGKSIGLQGQYDNDYLQNLQLQEQKRKTLADEAFRDQEAQRKQDEIAKSAIEDAVTIPKGRFLPQREEQLKNETLDLMTYMTNKGSTNPSYNPKTDSEFQKRKIELESKAKMFEGERIRAEKDVDEMVRNADIYDKRGIEEGLAVLNGQTQFSDKLKSDLYQVPKVKDFSKYTNVEKYIDSSNVFDTIDKSVQRVMPDGTVKYVAEKGYDISTPEKEKEQFDKAVQHVAENRDNPYIQKIIAEKEEEVIKTAPDKGIVIEKIPDDVFNGMVNNLVAQELVNKAKNSEENKTKDLERPKASGISMDFFSNGSGGGSNKLYNVDRYESKPLYAVKDGKKTDKVIGEYTPFSVQTRATGENAKKLKIGEYSDVQVDVVQVNNKTGKPEYFDITIPAHKGRFNKQIPSQKKVVRVTDDEINNFRTNIGSRLYDETIGAFKPIKEAEKKTAPKAAPKDYGTRPDGTKKGKGYFGELKMEDGSGSVATEISINFDDVLGGALIPLLVPTLTESEKKHLLKGNKATKEIQLKAIKHAEERASKGLSPFVDGGELKSKSGKPIYWDKTAKTYKYK